MKDLLSKTKVQNERGYAITRQMPYTNGYQCVENFAHLRFIMFVQVVEAKGLAVSA